MSDGAGSVTTKAPSELNHAELVRLRCLELALATQGSRGSPGKVVDTAEIYREYLESKKIPIKIKKTTPGKSAVRRRS